MAAEARSLRRTLVLWLLPVAVVVLATSSLTGRITVAALADSAYDRSLAGALRVIEANISTRDGGLGVELPYYLFATLQSTAAGTVYVRVSSDDGLVQIGDPGLPEPATALAPGEMRFYDATYLGEPVRVAALRRALPAPLYGAAEPQSVLLQLGESTGSRAEFLGRVQRLALWRDLAAEAVTLGLLWLAVGAALKPLRRLRASFDRRAADDLTPIPAAALPREVQPLIDSFNGLLLRQAALARAQRQLLDTASHQLRTPLSILRMQLELAMGARDPAERAAALQAMAPVIDRSARTTAQMLALARAGHLSAEAAPRPAVALAAVLTELARMQLPAARRRRIDLELDLPGAALRVAGDETLLYEALSNLMDNALRHAPVGGTVALALVPEPEPGQGAGMARITVTDGGPGMAPALLARIGERFLGEDGAARTADGAARAGGGTGLGLALVVAVAEAHGGRFEARNRRGGGFEASLLLPLLAE
ncbi:sensor histidine kinase N-terminal domain-containing protein [Frigidibacter sp. MR17.14]|uniref:sensor histidine kinase n=1 Tax=Frigidibacter sp. MR17.14 TaxID=3126509 RepID=UPI003012AC2C